MAVLSWLYSGSRIGHQAEQRSVGAVNQLKPLLSSWLSSGLVTSSDMGRAASKMESVEAVLAKLEEVFASFQKSSKPYGSGKLSSMGQSWLLEDGEPEVLWALHREG